jgi:hypothetical protein
VIGSRSTHQLRGLRNEPSPTETFLPRRSSRLDEPGVGGDLEPNSAAIGAAVSWRAPSGLGHHVRHVAVGERLGGRLGHLPAQLGEVEVGQPPVQDLGGL